MAAHGTTRENSHFRPWPRDVYRHEKIKDVFSCEGSGVSGRQASLDHDAGIGDMGDIVECSLLEEDEVLRTLRARLQPDVH